MIKKLLFVFAMLLSFSARADYVWYGPNGGGYSDAGSACAGAFAYNSTKDHVVYTYDHLVMNSTGDVGTCWGKWNPPWGGTSDTTLNVSRTGSGCSAGKTYNSSTGSCDSACGSNDTKNLFNRKFVFAAGSSSLPVSDGTCKIKDVQVNKCFAKADGSRYCYLLYHQTTESADPKDSPTNAPTPDSSTSPTDKTSPVSPTDKPVVSPPITPDKNNIDCPPGTSAAGLDSGGVVVCRGMGVAPPPPVATPTVTQQPSTVTTAADGTQTTRQVTTQSNSDGSTSTTTTTVIVAPDGTKKTSVSTDTGPASDGTAGRKDTGDGEAEKGDMCKQHPDLTVCKNSSVSGSCESVSCTGDAIQCATLRAAAKLQCQAQKDSDDLKASPLVQSGNAIIAGNDVFASKLPELVKGETVDVSAASLDQSGFLPGSCLADRSFSVLGRPVTVSFTSVCSNVMPLRYVFMSMAFLIVYLTVARSVIGGV
jgi:hypothetical protein